MTTPRLAHATKYGRLYQKPDADPTLLRPALEAIERGLLLPSVTNVIDVLSKPFLQTWYGKRAAEDAVQINSTHPGLIEAKPVEAIKWISTAALRTSNSAAELGDKVHNAVEMLARGEEPEVTPDIEGHIKSWLKFVKDYNPEFLFLEATAYGTVSTVKGPKGYAGTADFIAKINGKTYVGDYKTGKSIHTEAALQLAALSHAQEILEEASQTLVAMPKIDGGFVVHLTSKGYSVFVINDLLPAWEQFQKMRDLWDFHQTNLNSRAPLFMEKEKLDNA